MYLKVGQYSPHLLIIYSNGGICFGKHCITKCYRSETGVTSYKLVYKCIFRLITKV